VGREVRCGIWGAFPVWSAPKELLQMIALTLPLPPTLNHYYGKRGSRSFIKAAGQEFRQAVQEIVAQAGHKTLEGRVAVFAAIHPKNRIRQDIMNREKALSDALTHAGVWLDDSQIDDFHIVRREVIKGGMVRVVITEIENVSK
jgi:crossover junction endodeoxyribonuclease RusA